MGFLGELADSINGFLADGEWRTLKNGKRVKLNDEGRIVAGLPDKYHGIHVGDFGRVSKEERDLLGIDCDELAGCHKCVRSFKSKDQAYRALLDANPDLEELRSSEFGSYDLAFIRWMRNGRRGPKPRTKITDGRLNAINEHYDLKGARRVASFTEAIYHAIPNTHRWKDLEARLRPLEEAAGIRINLPDEALKLDASSADVEQCRADVDARISALFERAREERIDPPPADDGVPF